MKESVMKKKEMEREMILGGIRRVVTYKYWDEFWSMYKFQHAGFMVGEKFYPSKSFSSNTEPVSADQLNWFEDGDENGYTTDFDASLQAHKPFITENFTDDDGDHPEVFRVQRPLFDH
jgi:hypothetical protein